MATIRKQHGHFLEDFRPGALLRHKGGKTVTEGLFALFTDFSMTANPLVEERPLRAGVRLPRTRRAARARDGDRLQPERRGRLRERARQPRVHRHAVRRAGLRRRHARGRDAGPRREGLVEATRASASCTCRPRAATRTARSCSPSSARCRSGRRTRTRRSPTARTTPRDVAVVAPAARRTTRRATTGRSRTSPAPTRTLEDFRAGDVFEHTRGRVVTTDHIMLTGILDNTSQVHCNQWMVDAAAGALRRRPADRLRRHPLQPLSRHRAPPTWPTTRSATCAT